MQTKIVSSFEIEKMQTQCNVLSYRIDLYFHDHMLPIKIDENGQSNRKKNIDCEKIRKEKELWCKFVRIDPGKEYFDIFRSINEIFRHIKQSTKKNSNK